MSAHSLLLTLVLVAALLLVGCRADGAPLPAVPEGAQAGDLIGVEACEFQPGGQGPNLAAECGTLAVPENGVQADVRLIALPVVRIPASGSDSAEPVYYLQGGPGAPNLSWAPPDGLLAAHAVVMVGQRGAEGTATLSCPEVRPWG